MDHNEIFDMVLPDDARWLKAMMDAVNTIDGAKEFITTRYVSLDAYLYPSDNKILTSIMNYPAVYDCGHTMGTASTASWTIHTVKYYLQEGPAKVLEMRLYALDKNK